MKRQRSAQTISEYVILVSLVVAAVAAMFPFVKRGAQSLIKTASDQIADQKTSDQNFQSKSGYMIGSNTIAGSSLKESIRTEPAYVQHLIGEKADMITSSSSNLGFTEEE